MSPPLRIWADLSAAQGEELRPGRDVVVEASAAEAGVLLEGVLLDDWLDGSARSRAEAEARGYAATWVKRWVEPLTVWEAALPWVWEVEIYRAAALPGLRLVAGAREAAAATGAGAVEVHGLGAGEAAAVQEGLSDRGCTVRSMGTAGSLGLPEDRTLLSGAQRLAMAAGVPLPHRVRGDVRLLRYWHLDPVMAELSRRGRHLPLLDPAALPPLSRGALLRLARRGGWVGTPGRRSLGRSARAVDAALAAAAEAPDAGALERLVHRRAVELLRRRAARTPAVVERNRRVFRSGRIRALVLPFDSVASARAVLLAAREHGVPSLLVQHGFAPEPDDPDARESDQVAVWNRHQAEAVRARTRAPVTVTGNPGSARERQARVPQTSPGSTVLLVQMATPYSIRWDARVSRRCVDAGLRALAVTRPGSRVIVRPHPLDPDPRAHLPADPLGLQVVIERSRPIEALLAEADLCIGGVSTATLQAGVAGVPVVFLDVTPGDLPWPFDGSSGVPQASGADDLVEAIPRALESDEVPGAEALADALGARPDALERVVDLIESVAERP